MQEYREVELIRRSVRDVKKRGQELDKFRKMQGKAYEGVRSKVGRNIKVVTRVNKAMATQGDVTPTRRRPKTVMFNSTMNVKVDLTTPTGFADDSSWERTCTNDRFLNQSATVDHLRVADGGSRNHCCCHSSNRSTSQTKSRAELINEYSNSVLERSLSSSRSFMTKS